MGNLYADFAVIDLERSDPRLPLRDSYVPGSIMPHENDVVGEVNRVVLRKDPPAPRASITFIATTFFTSYSPATGIWRAVSSYVARMIELFVSSLASSPDPS
jgi:hypothetical protein